MRSWQQAMKNSVIPGLIAGTAAGSTAAAFGRRDSGSAIAPINASSHVLWGDRAARVERATLQHTLPGAMINVGAGVWWALVLEKLFGARIDKGGIPTALAAGAATAALAYVVDYKLIPERLTPGWERRISDRSLFMTLAAMGLSLTAGALLMRRANQDNSARTGKIVQ